MVYICQDPNIIIVLGASNNTDNLPKSSKQIVVVGSVNSDLVMSAVNNCDVWSYGEEIVSFSAFSDTAHLVKNLWSRTATSQAAAIVSAEIAAHYSTGKFNTLTE